MNSDQIKTQVIEALEEIKAKAIEVLDVRALTALFDFMIIASADSTRQTRALAKNVEDRLRHLLVPIIGLEGQQSGEWILVDAGSVVTHIMQPAIRDYYDLGVLWGGKPAIPFKRVENA